MKPDEKPVAPEAGCNQMEREVAEQQPLLENNTPAQPGTAAHADNGWKSREADNSMAPFEAETPTVSLAFHDSHKAQNSASSRATPSPRWVS